MDIKKIFINCMVVLCVLVVIFSVFTVVKRNTEPQENTEITYDNMMENSEIVIGTEYDEDVESTESTEVADVPSDEKVLYTTSKVNVRTGPATTYSSLGEIPAGTQVAGVGELDDAGWQKINYNGQEAYILGRYLTDEAPEEEDEEEQQTSNRNQSSNRGNTSSTNNSNSNSSNVNAFGLIDPYHGHSVQQNSNNVVIPNPGTGGNTGGDTTTDQNAGAGGDTTTEPNAGAGGDTTTEPNAGTGGDTTTTTPPAETPAVPETPVEPAE